MPSFFDLQKFAATGIASADMSAFDKARALAAFGGGKTRTLTDVPPLSFPSNGSPITIWSMLGNTQQTGTPSPQSIIMPTFCGVRTGNLWDEDYTGISGNLKYVPVYVGDGSFTMSTDTPIYSVNAPLFLLSGNVTSGASTPINGVYNGVSRTTNSSNGYITIAFRWQSEESNPVTHKTMLNLGSTALPYEHYGYKIPLTCAGQTVPVYLGQTQTVRRIKKFVLTGDESWSEGTSNYYIYINVSGRENGIPKSTALSTHTESGVVVNGNGTALFFKKSVFVQSSLADFKSYLAQQYANGTPVCVWYVLAEPTTGIINEPLCKIGDYADELHSTDAGVTIPTVKGSNTLTVETELQPSSMTITYKK